MGVIGSFGDDETRKIWEGEVSLVLPQSIQRPALRKLEMLDAATSLRDLTSPPGNRLERLAGDWAGWWSIRINRQWRIVFRWEAPQALEVQIIDYH